MEDSTARIAAKVNDEFRLVGRFGKADEFLRNALEVDIVYLVEATDKIGDAENGYLIIGWGVEVIACDEILWMTDDGKWIAWCGRVGGSKIGSCA